MDEISTDQLYDDYLDTLDRSAFEPTPGREDDSRGAKIFLRLYRIDT
jgi:hypothetical protein